MSFSLLLESNTPPPNESQLNTNRAANAENNETDSSVPTKADGTADMRYKESKEAVASGAIESGEQLTETNDVSTTAHDGGIEGKSVHHFNINK